MANKRYTQFYYTPHVMPVQLDCTFTVDPTAAAGVSSLTGTGVSAVYMASSTTSSDPIFEPADGVIHVKLSQNFAKLFAMDYNMVPPVTGAEISISGSSVLTQGVPYQITTVGTSTTANWQAAGLPAGITPAVGQVFIAKITGSGTGTGKVKALGVTGIQDVVVLNPNTACLAPTGFASVQGGWLILQTMGATDATTTTQIPKAPTTGSIITLKFLLSNSSLNATQGY